MPRDVSDRRLRLLETQRDFIEGELEHQRLPFEGDITSRLSKKIEESLNEAGRRYQHYLDLTHQNAPKHLKENQYERYVRQLDFAQGYLDSIEKTISYVQLFHEQNKESSGSLDHGRQLFTELANDVGIDVEIIPIKWDGYTLLPIIEAELYVLWLPRERNYQRHAPMIGHELGHAVLDHMDQTPTQEFRDRLEEFIEPFPDERRDQVFYAWNQWFDELFCDGMGFFCFGPAYALSAIEQFQHTDPYFFPDQIGPNTEFHPPDALRFRFINELSRRWLPESMYQNTLSYRREFEQHLELRSNEKPAFYDRWIDDELLSIIVSDAEHRGPQLQLLIEALSNESLEQVVSSHRHRMASNEYWVDEVQNGGY